MDFIFFITLWNIFCFTISTQQPAFETKTTTQQQLNETTTQPQLNETTTTKPINVVQKIFKTLSAPITQIVAEPKIRDVFRNIGTCIVNGFMEIITYYLPAPFIPLIASAAGQLIPLEPVITLRRLMPVTSYKRALQTAFNGFMNTFNRYKMDEDPYMTRWFRRRFFNEDRENKE